MLYRNKGSYQTVTAFFFVVVLVSAILILVSNNLVVAQQQMLIVQYNQDYLNSRIAIERIIACHGTVDIEIGKLDNECTYGPFLKSYTIEVMESDGCDWHIIERQANEGDVNQRIIYYVPIRADETHIICLGRIMVEI